MFKAFVILIVSSYYGEEGAIIELPFNHEFSIIGNCEHFIKTAPFLKFEEGAKAYIAQKYKDADQYDMHVTLGPKECKEVH